MSQSTHHHTRSEQQSRWTLKLEEDLELEVGEQSLEKVTTVNTFVTEFAFAIQNTWVTTLMVSFCCESYFDCFMWTIPIWVSVLIRPYLDAYVNKFRLSFGAKLRHMAAFYIGAAVGHLIIILSMYPTFAIDVKQFMVMPFHFLRIITGIVGWTVMDVCLDFVLSNNDGVEELKEKIQNGQKSTEDTDFLALVARLCAYGLSAYTCVGPFTFRNFQLYTGLMYFVSGLLCLFGALHTYLQNRWTVLKGQQIQKEEGVKKSLIYLKESVFETKIRIDTYFPGYSETLVAPLEMKQYLAMNFAYNYVADTVYIYTCIWMACSLVSSEDITAEMFIVGIQRGAALLAGLSLMHFLTRKIFGSQSKSNHKQFVKNYTRVVFLTIVAAMYASLTFDPRGIAAFVVLTGAFVGMSELFFEAKQQEIESSHDSYNLCLGFVGTLEKVFILCPMPIFWLVLRADDDVPNCLWWAVIALFVVYLLASHQYYQCPVVEVTETKDAEKTEKAAETSSAEPARTKSE